MLFSLTQIGKFQKRTGTASTIQSTPEIIIAAEPLSSHMFFIVRTHA
jgi:hypothetical protein